jgi:ankyrin repeat protein
LDVAGSTARTPLLAPALIERTTQLERRIRLLDMHARSASKPLLLTAALALISVTGMAMAQVVPPQPLRIAAATYSKKSGGPELLDALLERDSNRAIELIDTGADISYGRLGDGTPLIVAARTGLVPVVERLLAQGADVNQESPGDGNPLIAAAASGNEQIATLLVAAGANVNALVEDDETPLINAAGLGHLGMVQYLLDQGADVNFSVVANKLLAPERRSALSQAEKHGHHDLANYLRARGAKS